MKLPDYMSFNSWDFKFIPPRIPFEQNEWNRYKEEVFSNKSVNFYGKHIHSQVIFYYGLSNLFVLFVTFALNAKKEKAADFFTLVYVLTFIATVPTLVHSIYLYFKISFFNLKVKGYIKSCRNYEHFIISYKYYCLNVKN